MTSKEQLFQIITESQNAKTVFAIAEAVSLILQGKSDEEIKKHFGLA